MSWGKYYSSRPLNEKRANFISTSIAFIFCESVQNIILVVKPGFTFLFCGFAIRLSSSSIQLHSCISPSLHRRNRSSFKICVQPVVSHPLFTNMWNRYYWKMKKLKYSCLIYWRKYFAQTSFKHGRSWRLNSSVTSWMLLMPSFIACLSTSSYSFLFLLVLFPFFSNSNSLNFADQFDLWVKCC